jgi:hypothetical protein
MKKYANVPWVFWFTVRIRRNWFKIFWTARGSNFREFQIWIFQISIGRPWLNSTMTYPDYYDENTKEINDGNLKSKFSILIR